MTFTLGSKSMGNLIGVHPDLIALVKDAIQTSREDFVVQEGLRSPETQKIYYTKGVTKTLNSKHLKQSDGYGHAVDLVPLVDGVPRWEWPLIYPIASSMQAASIKLGVPLRWGGAWDKIMKDFTGPPKRECEQYATHHPGPDFLDGPHYELVKGN